MIDVRALIGDIPTTTIELTPRCLGTPEINAFGETVIEDATPIEVVAVVHPTDKRRSIRAPEANYARESITIYVLSEDAFDVARAIPAPLVSYQGRTYEPIAIADYATLGGVVIVEADLRDEVAP